jgi:hypothetical protein
VKKIFSILSLFISITCNAQLPPIDTDRPDQTESVNLVPKRWIQFEAGFDYQRIDPQFRQYVIPTLLSKYGLSRRVELRLITTISNQHLDVPPFGKLRSTVCEPVEIGAKIALVEEKKLRPKTSLIFHAGIPGLSTHKTTNFLFNTRLTMQNTISKNISLGYNVGMEFDGYSRDPVFIYTISPGFTIGDKWYAYIEAFGTLFEHPEHSIDGGLAYYFTNDIKADISGGLGLSPGAPDYYFSLGFSIRFKTGR